MNRRVATITCASLFAMGGAASAHHGWGSYDAMRMMTIEGAVEQVGWQNPHVHVAVNHDGATWDLVLAPPLRMTTRGVTQDMLRPGARIRAEGYLSLRVQHEMRPERIAVEGKIYELR